MGGCPEAALCSMSRRCPPITKPSGEAGACCVPVASMHSLVGIVGLRPSAPPGVAFLKTWDLGGPSSHQLSTLKFRRKLQGQLRMARDSVQPECLLLPHRPLWGARGLLGREETVSSPDTILTLRILRKDPCSSGWSPCLSDIPP